MITLLVRKASACGLYYKNSTIVIYGRNDSGQYYEIMIMIVFTILAKAKAKASLS